MPFPWMVQLRNPHHSANISPSTSRTSLAVTWSSSPSRRINRVLLRARSWSSATLPLTPANRHATRNGAVKPPAVNGALITVIPRAPGSADGKAAWPPSRRPAATARQRGHNGALARRAGGRPRPARWSWLGARCAAFFRYGLLSSLHPQPTVETVCYCRSCLTGLWNPCSSVKPVSSVGQQVRLVKRPRGYESQDLNWNPAPTVKEGISRWKVGLSFSQIVLWW